MEEESRQAELDRESEIIHEIAARAIRRLDILEYVILGMAAALALIAGALVAWLLSQTLQVGFRPTWIAVSLALFVIPAAIVRWRSR